MHLHIFIVYFVSNSTGRDTNLKLEIFIHRPKSVEAFYN